MRWNISDIPLLRNWPIVLEFLAALGDRRTYNPRRNGYVFFGILWGIPVPIVTIGVNLYVLGLAPTPANILHILVNHPFQIIFLLHPLLFGILFGALGTVRDRKEQRIAGLLEDVHARVQELEALNAQLREADQIKDEFLSTISHELKTPIVTVKGYLEMLLRGRAGPLDARQKRILDVMQHNVARQLNLIDDLLNYVRIHAHPDDRDHQVFDLREVIRETRETFAPALEKKGLTLEIDLPNCPLWVQAHRSNIEIIFSNLLSNAIKFTDRGGVIRIESKETPNGRIVNWCSDTGCGIPAESVPYIFERFRQADSSTRRKHGGTGLGLAIIKKILDDYGCPIRVQTCVGEGTTFYFELPPAPGRTRAAGSAPAAASSEGSATHG
ncbi:MAG: HAMP domain-containing histidine kinase [Candidatus Sumerlaeia bacterium]|nr:HAMP domain-containing histidine kinase [Candidatus Sumerlaeia bacterium]